MPELSTLEDYAAALLHSVSLVFTTPTLFFVVALAAVLTYLVCRWAFQVRVINALATAQLFKARYDLERETAEALRRVLFALTSATEIPPVTGIYFLPSAPAPWSQSALATPLTSPAEETGGAR